MSPAAGATLRVDLELPIRHGKTEHDTAGDAADAAHRLEREPDCRVCSYTRRRAGRFSRDIRRLVADRGVPLCGE